MLSASSPGGAGRSRSPPWNSETLERLRTTESEVATKDQLIRSVSHELRTPLTALLGYAELLGDHELDDEERTTMVRTIVRQGRDLSNIVEDLLTRAHVEADTLTVARVPISLGAQAAQVVEDWAPEQRDAITATTDRSVRAAGDPARIRQVIRNLVSNAFRYGDGTVTISTRLDEDEAMLSVANPGPAIPPAEAAGVFEPYLRLKGASPAPGGLGLGLAISRRLVMMMDGSLDHHRKGDETVFTIRLKAL